MPLSCRISRAAGTFPGAFCLSTSTLCLLLLGCGDATPDKGETAKGEGTFLSLEEPAAGSSKSQGEDASQVQAAEATLVNGQGEIRDASATTGGATSAGARALETWLRGMPAERSHLAPFSTTAATALTDFGTLWEHGAARYRSQLQQERKSASFSPETLGADFATYAGAFADGGRDGLSRSLASGVVGSMAWLAWTEASVQLDLDLDHFQQAGLGLGRLIDGYLAAGFDRLRVAALAPDVQLVGRHAREYLPSREYQVQSGDSYDRLCRSFRKQGLACYIGWVADFNHKRNYNLRAEETLLIPEAKLQIRAWRGARLAVLQADGIPIRLYEVSMGREGEPTPLGDFTLATCLKDPVWYRTNASPVPAGNPDNPLGKRWMGFEEDPQYGFHGTNSEDTIGGYESGGCVRMHNADAMELFDLVGPGVPVSIYP